MRILLFTFGLAASVACGRGAPQPPGDQPQHPLLVALQPPPLNLPSKAAPISDERPGLPPGDDSALVVLSEGRIFYGSVAMSGRVAMDQGNIDVVGQDGRSIQILYRLPGALSALDSTKANGSLIVTERSTGLGPNRHVILRSDNSLLLGHTWVRSSAPVTMDLSSDLRIIQRPIPPSPRGQLIAPAEVQAFDGDRIVAEIPVRKSTRIRTRAGVLEVLVETSHFGYSSGPPGQQSGGYILQAWVVGSK